MSSRTRIRSECRRLRAPALLLTLLAALVAVQPQEPVAAAAPVPLPVAAVLVRGARTTLVVDLSASTRPGRRSVSVTRDGEPQQAELVPVLSDGLGVALVVDASTAGAATLPAWQSAAARFILEAPATAQAVVITDSAPAAAITGPQRGPTGIVRALTSVPARGERDTAAALTLAMRQFPAAAPGRRLVVLYTTAAGAGGTKAGALAARFLAGGTILVVVGTAGADPYWADVASATGGFFAPAGDPVVVPALDQVQTVLRSRYLVRLRTPPTLPTSVSVRVSTGDLTLAGEATVALPPVRGAAPRAARDRLPIWVSVLLVLAVACLVAAHLRRRRQPPAAGNPPANGEDQASPVARGRATVPPPVVRGRAAVPGAEIEDR